MNKRISRIIMIVCSCCLTLCSCNRAEPSAKKPEEHHYEEITDLAGIIDVFEDNGLKLSVNCESFNIMVTDKKSNTVWLSNPEDLDTDPVATGDYIDIMKSQFSFTYSFNRAQRTMYGYTDCTMNSQYKLFKIDGGVRVEYIVGDAELTIDDMPMKLSSKRYDELFTNNASLNEEDKAAISELFEKNDDIYEWIQYIFDDRRETAIKTVQKSGYSTEDLRRDAAEFGEKIEVEDKFRFMIPVEYTIKDGAFHVRVPIPEIEYPPNSPINTLNILEFFGAMKSNQDGYIFIPDGSGALINFDQKTHTDSQLSLPVYGRDKVIGTVADETLMQPVAMPVFGIKGEGKAFYANIIDSDAIADINSMRAGRNSSYNAAYASFRILAQDKMNMGDPNNLTPVTVNQPKTYDGDIHIAYTFLGGTDASYQGMARHYRSVLLSKGYKTLNSSDSVPLALELIGAVNSPKSFLGISYSGLKAFTDYKQAKEIITKLDELGVDSVNLIYSGWCNGGYDQWVPAKIKPEGVLGNIKTLLELESDNVHVYPSVSFLKTPTSKKLSMSSQTAKSIEQRYARTYKTGSLSNSETGIQNASSDDTAVLSAIPDEFIISPSYLDKLTDRFLSSYSKQKFTKLGIADMGSEIYADYSKDHTVDRQSASSIIVNQLSKLSKEQTLLLKGVTSRTGLYAPATVNAPLSSSGYRIADEEVPFFQMVFHGLMTYTGTPVNFTSETRTEYLKAIGFGASVYFVMTYADSSEIIETEHQELHSTYYKDWIETAAEMYQGANLLSELQERQIVDYIKLSPDVYKTIYDSGTAITVNYSEVPYRLPDGSEVPANDFVVTVI